MKIFTGGHSIVNTVPFFLFCFITLMPLSVLPLYSDELSAVDPYAETLVKKADELKLYDDQYWHVLVHYKKSIFGYSSQIDDSRFFLSADGKTDPRAEMHATIRAFFETNDSERTRAVCKYIARYTWLKEKLLIDESKLLYPVCTAFYEVIKKEKPNSVTLVYPAGYINSPASMYGHTFLIIELEGKKRLVSSAINYMAHTDESFGPLFAVRGLIGHYPGYFSMLPYYEKVSEYSDFEKRNIWEYTLDFTPEETQRMLMHVAELDGIYSNYFFLDENCSYNLMWILEAARPSLSLVENLGIFVEPIGTIREVGKNNIIKNVTYRPSKEEKIIYLASKLSKKQIAFAVDIAERKKSPGEIGSVADTQADKMFILELAAEYLQVRRGKEKISSSDYSKTLIPILTLRSTMGKNDEGIEKIPVPYFPEKSHKSGRLTFGGGWRDNDYFQELYWRPTYHSLIDRHEGFTFGEEIIFLALSARYYDKQKKPVFQSFDAIDVISIPASNQFTFNWAWKIRTGISQIKLHDDKEHLTGYFDFGGGGALDIPFIGRAYLMFDGEALSSPAMTYYAAAGAGGTAGILNRITPWWTMHLSVRSLYYPVSEEHLFVKASFIQRFSFTMNTALITGCSLTRQYGRMSKEASAGFSVYY